MYVKGVGVDLSLIELLQNLTQSKGLVEGVLTLPEDALKIFQDRIEDAEIPVVGHTFL